MEISDFPHNLPNLGRRLRPKIPTARLSAVSPTKVHNINCALQFHTLVYISVAGDIKANTEGSAQEA
jgi:hypothetical protein